MSSKQITTKKQKFIGYKELVDPETGEKYPMQMNVIEDRDFNFTKVWMQNLVNSIEGVINQKMKLAFWIIENLDKENQLIMTQRTIAKKTGISLKTVSSTIKLLCTPSDGGIAFLQKINSGAYRVNPNVIFKGSHNNRMGLCFEYRKNNLKNTQE